MDNSSLDSRLEASRKHMSLVSVLHTHTVDYSKHTHTHTHTVWYWLSVMWKMTLQQWGTNRRRDSVGLHCKQTHTHKFSYPSGNMSVHKTTPRSKHAESREKQKSSSTIWKTTLWTSFFVRRRGRDTHTYLRCCSAHVSHHPARHARLEDVGRGKVINLLQRHLTQGQQMYRNTSVGCERRGHLWVRQPYIVSL